MEDLLKEIVEFHIEQNKFHEISFDEMVSNIMKNIEECTRREIASQMDLKCMYSGYTHKCHLCHQCIEDGEFENIEDMVDCQDHHSVMQDMYEVEMYSRHGHPI